jgi:hypothetical protein
VNSELLQWGTVASGFVMLFGYLTLLANHGRRVMESQRSRTSYVSGLLLGVIAVFVILGLALPGGYSGANYTTLYQYLIMYAGAGLYSAWIHHPYNCYRYFRFTSTYSAIFFITWLFVIFRDIPIIVAIAPPTYNIATWIEQVVAASANWTALGVAGVGTLVLGVRALIGKEPGLMEMEAV